MSEIFPDLPLLANTPSPALYPQAILIWQQASHFAPIAFLNVFPQLWTASPAGLRDLEGGSSVWLVHLAASALPDMMSALNQN